MTAKRRTGKRALAWAQAIRIDEKSDQAKMKGDGVLLAIIGNGWPEWAFETMKETP